MKGRLFICFLLLTNANRLAALACGAQYRNKDQVRSGEYKSKYRTQTNEICGGNSWTKREATFGHSD